MPGEAARSVIALSAAVALTDEVATVLINECAATPAGHVGAAETRSGAGEGRLARAIVACLRACDFVYIRNGEWHINPAVRSALLDRLYQEPEMANLAHSTLQRLARAAGAGGTGGAVPAYLTWSVGLAYHTAALDQQRGRELYAKAYSGKYSGDQLLLGVLTKEQHDRGQLPPGSIEPHFFQGMTAYHEGRWAEAEEDFRQVAKSEEVRPEVAIALHLLGRILYLRRHDSKEAVAFLRRSLTALDRLGDLYGQAQVLNTLATVVGKEDPKEAEALLRRSLKIGQRINHLPHQAQVLNSLGALIGQLRPREAEDFLRRSLKLRMESNDLRGQAQTLQSLANLIRRSKPAESEKLLRRSLNIDRRLHNLRGQAQVLQSLAILVERRDPAQAESLLKHSLKINERLGDLDGQARVLNSLGTFYSSVKNWESSRSAHQRAIEKTDGSRSLATAYAGLSRIAEEHDKNLREAVRLLKAAIKFQRRTGRAQTVRLMQQRLHKLKRRIEDAAN